MIRVDQRARARARARPGRSPTPGSARTSPARHTPRVVPIVVLIAALLWAAVSAASAQNILRWTTNYYTVTGATVREVRRSMSQARPWKNRYQADAVTAWHLEWKFTVAATGQGCRPDSVSTVTTITTTLPQYVPPTNASPDVRERWAKYFPALARHEARHAAIGQAAAADVQSRLASAGERANCDALRRELNELATRIVAQRRREEQEMDVQTRHGESDGARFP